MNNRLASWKRLASGCKNSLIEPLITLIIIVCQTTALKYWRFNKNKVGLIQLSLWKPSLGLIDRVYLQLLDQILGTDEWKIFGKLCIAEEYV